MQPLVFWNKLEVKTVEQVLNIGLPSIVKIKKDNGKPVLNAILIIALSDLIKSFNIGKTMQESQVIEAIEQIQNDYYFLNPAEIKLCFQNAKKGKYGILYDRIDLMTIYGFLDSYIAERSNEVEKQRQNEQKAHTKQIFEGSEIISTILKAIPEKVEPVKKVEPREKTEHEKFIQQVFIDFDKMHRDKPFDQNESTRTVLYDGKNLSCSEFLEVRLGEMNQG